MRRDKIQEARAKLDAGDYDDLGTIMGMLDECLDDMLVDLGDVPTPVPMPQDRLIARFRKAVAERRSSTASQLAVV